VRGVGLVQAPAPLVRAALDDGRLVEVLEGRSIVTPGVFLFHSGRRQVLPKLRAFIDHARAGRV
jgi:DNA-binding transcriptional LysR family regulator